MGPRYCGWGCATYFSSEHSNVSVAASPFGELRRYGITALPSKTIGYTYLVRKRTRCKGNPYQPTPRSFTFTQYLLFSGPRRP